ncbi:MAG TPA: hypothetical protein VHO70_11935, partial [Chitinispirillaceae bacterium]|nr:hypothetical protein [Chitinispirillaceae bacterium]
MADSEWESIRKKYSNRIRYGVGIGIPALLLAGFLCYNNRDLLCSAGQSENAADRPNSISKHTKSESIFGDEDHNRPERGMQKDSAVQIIDSVKTVQNASETKKTELKKTVEEFSDKKLLIEEDLVAETTTPGASLELSFIRCRTADHNGTVLNLSIELKSDHVEIEKKILIMRDDLRVLVQSVV